MSTSTGDGSVTELPPEIDRVCPFITRDCGVALDSFSPELAGAAAGAATQLLPFHVRTSPLFAPTTVKLSARIAVP